MLSQQAAINFIAWGFMDMSISKDTALHLQMG